MSHPGLLVLPLLGAAWLGLARDATTDEFVYHHENVMGTALELRVRAADEATATAAEAAVLAEIDRLSGLLSGYDPASAYRRWLDGSAGPVDVPAELFAVLDGADRWRTATGGAFEPRVAALSAVWSAAAERGTPPDRDEIAAALGRMAATGWRLDSSEGTAERLGDGPISLDGLAKGFILERACDAATAAVPGVRGLLLNVGGDLRAVGDEPWTVGLAPAVGDSEAAAPVASVGVAGRSVATSGRAHRGWTIGDRWYSHILDPRTGRPVERVVAATVVAPDGMDADALATAVNVLPVAEGLRLVESLPEVACLLVASDGQVARSARWASFERPAPLQDGAKDDTAGSWSETHEVAVDFEINRPEDSRRYRRPYVAIWVEDADDHVVRQLVMWISMGGSGPDQWLPDLKRWYRSDVGKTRIEKRSKAFTIGRSTRPPGEYTVVWDGKDDDGEPLPRGAYTLFIEAAREHGTYQLIRVPLEIGGQPFSEELEGNVEIKSAAVSYRRKPAE